MSTLPFAPLGALILAASLTSTEVHAQVGRAPLERTIDSLLRLMTLEEKLGQLNLLSVNQRPTAQELDLVRKGLVGGFLNVIGAEASREAQRAAVEGSRLKIPLLLGLDVIHGYRTIFPIPLAEAGTWNPELVEQAA